MTIDKSHNKITITLSDDEAFEEISVRKRNNFYLKSEQIWVNILKK